METHLDTQRRCVAERKKMKRGEWISHYECKIEHYGIQQIRNVLRCWRMKNEECPIKSTIRFMVCRHQHWFWFVGINSLQMNIWEISLSPDNLGFILSYRKNPNKISSCVHTQVFLGIRSQADQQWEIVLHFKLRQEKQQRRHLLIMFQNKCLLTTSQWRF